MISGYTHCAGGLSCSLGPQLRPGEQISQPKRTQKLTAHQQALPPPVILVVEPLERLFVPRRTRLQREDRPLQRTPESGADENRIGRIEGGLHSFRTGRSSPGFWRRF
jgi:hypothetical protein